MHGSFVAPRFALTAAHFELAAGYPDHTVWWRQVRRGRLFFGALAWRRSSCFAKGTRVLEQEEQKAFDLVQSLSDEQRATAVIAEQAPREIRGAGEPQPPSDEPVGVAYADLNAEQQQMMRELVGSYVSNVPESEQRKRIRAIRDAGPENVHFAWAGALKPGVGHYYRIQGPSFLIEFVNTQPDSAGNPANHIHCVWRDMNGDFALPRN